MSMFLYNCISYNNYLIMYDYNDMICVLSFGPLNHRDLQIINISIMLLISIL